MQDELDLAGIIDEEFEAMVAELVCRRFESTKSILLLVTQENFGEFRQKAMLIAGIKEPNNLDDDDARRHYEESNGITSEDESSEETD